MLELLLSPEAWIALLTLLVLELVLGIDNIIFLSITTSKLPPHQQDKARKIGLSLAMLLRILLLLGVAHLAKLTKPFWTLSLGNHDFGLSGRDLILLSGGLFLIYKATKEIHEKMEGHGKHIAGENAKPAPSFFGALAQILTLDLVFSLDSVITAVGMVKEVPVMIAAIILSIGIMLFAAKSISDFVDHRPTVKMLALAFLLMVGTTLVAEGLHFHVSKGYIYFAMAFSCLVEVFNSKTRKSNQNS
jgi:predicted tellurium resistance membrane protein TerC